MIDEARRSARIETDMSVAAEQNKLAQDSYDGIKVTVKQDGKDYSFTHHVTRLLERGDTFKRVSIADGEHFNDLPGDTPEALSYKKAAAKAVIAAQLSLRLSGANTDLDRHGGNIKIQGGKISHFDFGAMNITPLTSEDKLTTGQIVAQVIQDVRKGGGFNTAFIERIENADASEETRTYLEGLKKDFLALGDYVNVLDEEELEAVFIRSMTSKTMDVEIRRGFNKEIGMVGTYVNGALHVKALGAGIHIERTDAGMDDGSAPDPSSVRGAPEIKHSPEYDRRRENGHCPYISPK